MSLFVGPPAQYGLDLRSNRGNEDNNIFIHEYIYIGKQFLPTSVARMVISHHSHLAADTVDTSAKKDGGGHVLCFSLICLCAFTNITQNVVHRFG